jgi:hypothetical protein
MTKAVINLGDKETNLGLTLVALSRPRKMEDFVIAPMSFSRLEKVNNRKDLPQLREEMQRLHNNKM